MNKQTVASCPCMETPKGKSTNHKCKGKAVVKIKAVVKPASSQAFLVCKRHANNYLRFPKLYKEAK